MKSTTLQSIIDQDLADVYLVDASGVLYNHLGPFDGTVDAVSLIQESGKSFIVLTNNTSSYIDLISEKFRDHGISIPTDHIISSGLGLVWDEKARQIVNNKQVYVYGWETSGQYVEDAGGILVSEITDSEVICFAASEKGDNDDHCNQVIDFMTNHPTVEGICINPDHYVMHYGDRYPVIGYYAARIEREVPQSFYWIGKPEPNMSFVVKKILETRFNIIPNSRVWFFDDNINNVQQLVSDLSVTGSVVLDTGLASDVSLSFIDERLYSIDVFSV